MSGIEITKFRKADGLLSKRISLTKGKIKSDGGACKMAKGTARRVKLNGPQSLADLIESLGSNEALALGRLRDGLPDKAKVVSKSEITKRTPGDTIARSGDYLQFKAGAPAYMLLDHDRKGAPKGIVAKIKTAGGFWNAVVECVPELGNAARVSRSSTSAGLYNTETDEKYPGSANRHVYLAVKNGDDIPRALKTLHERLWLAGYGYMITGAIGQLLDRSIIDAAVYGPERLVFEGKPVLIEPVGQDQEVRRPKVRSGETIDTAKAILSLTADEARQVEKLKSEAKKLLAPEAATKRTEWAKRFAADRGLSRKEAEKIASAACKHVLHAEWELEFDNLGTTTVAEVLAEPDHYVGETLADPLEGTIRARSFCSSKVCDAKAASPSPFASRGAGSLAGSGPRPFHFFQKPNRSLTNEQNT